MNLAGERRKKLALEKKMKKILQEPIYLIVSTVPRSPVVLDDYSRFNLVLPESTLKTPSLTAEDYSRG